MFELKEGSISAPLAVTIPEKSNLRIWQEFFKGVTFSGCPIKYYPNSSSNLSLC